MSNYNNKLYPEPSDKKNLLAVKEFFRLKYTTRLFEKKDDESSGSEEDYSSKKKA